MFPDYLKPVFTCCSATACPLTSGFSTGLSVGLGAIARRYCARKTQERPSTCLGINVRILDVPKVPGTPATGSGEVSLAAVTLPAGGTCIGSCFTSHCRKQKSRVEVFRAEVWEGPSCLFTSGGYRHSWLVAGSPHVVSPSQGHLPVKDPKKS